MARVRPSRPPGAPDEHSFELEAELLRVLAHPKRLMIVALLTPGSRTVTDLANHVGLSVQNTSQHLRLLSDRSIVRGERHGRLVRYTLTSPSFPVACRLLREGLLAEARSRAARTRTAAGNLPGSAPPPTTAPHLVRPLVPAQV